MDHSGAGSKAERLARVGRLVGVGWSGYCLGLARVGKSARARVSPRRFSKQSYPQPCPALWTAGNAVGRGAEKATPLC
jgi:hypothetical protein